MLRRFRRTLSQQRNEVAYQMQSKMGKIQAEFSPDFSKERQKLKVKSKACRRSFVPRELYDE